MYMYINQLIMGIMLHRYVDQRAFHFRFVLFFYLFFAYFHYFFFSSFSTYLCCTRRSSAGRTLKNFPSKRPSTSADSLSIFFSSFRFALIFRNICYTRRRTTSIGWHIKRKQHLDQSRRDNSYIQT